MNARAPGAEEGALLGEVLESTRVFRDWINEERPQPATAERFGNIIERQARLHLTLARALFALVEHWDEHGAERVDNAGVVEQVRQHVAAIDDRAGFLTWTEGVTDDSVELAERIRSGGDYWTTKECQGEYESIVAPSREQMTPLLNAAKVLDNWDHSLFGEMLQASIAKYAKDEGLPFDERVTTGADGSTFMTVTVDMHPPAPRRPWWRFWGR